MATKKGENNKTPRRVGGRKAADSSKITLPPSAKKIANPLKPAPGTAADPMQQLVDAFTNPLARIGFGTPSLLEGTRYPITRLSNAYELLISLYRNSWISRNLIDGYVDDAFRNGFELQTEAPPKLLDQFDYAYEETATEEKLIEVGKWARLFGGAVALMAIEGHEKILHEPLDVDDVEIDSYRGLIVFDRWSGVSPEGTISSDIRRPLEFGKPEWYLIQPENGSPYKVHATRLLRFIGPAVPRWELQAQQYWGISEIEVMFEELKKYDNVWWAIANMCYRANIFVLSDPAIAQMVSGIGISGQAARQAYLAYEALSQQMSNQGLVVLGKDGSLQTTQSNFAGLADVLNVAMLNIAGATGYPVSRLFGRTISGLGQTNEGDESQYYDRVGQKQKRDYSPQLRKLLPVIAMSTWGQVPKDLKHKWLPIQQSTPQEKAELGKSLTDAVLVAFNAGLVDEKTSLEELKQSSEETSLWSNISNELIAGASTTPAFRKQAEMQNMMSQMGAPGAGGPEGEGGASEGSENGEQPEPPNTEGEAEEEENPEVESSKEEKPEEKQNILQKMLAALRGGNQSGSNKEVTGPDGTVKIREPRPTGRDAAPAAIRRMRVDPSDLTFREHHQARMAQVASHFKDGITLPLALIRRGEELEILDGHHRAVLATQSGWHRLPAVTIEGAEYDRLKEAGYSDDEITAGLLKASGYKPASALEESEHEEDEPQIGERATQVARQLQRAKDAHDHNTPKQLTHRNFNGFDVTVEYPAGKVRELKDKNGNVVYSKLLKHDYGFIKGTKAVDGDEVDVILGPSEKSPTVFIVDMIDLGSDLSEREDEPKTLLGFTRYNDAFEAFVEMYSLPFFGGMTEMTIPEFRDWLDNPSGLASEAGHMETQKEEAVPRDADGRFGTKGYSRKSDLEHWKRQANERRKLNHANA